jgi:phage internal scaffolding protein
MTKDSIPKRRFRNSYDPSRPIGSDTGRETRTKQSFKDECDINSILRRYETSGQITHLNKGNASFGDFTQALPYDEAIRIVRQAEERFMSLSARVRERFQNDPSQFLAFADNPANLEEMVAMGLAHRTSPVDTSGASKAPAKPKPSKAGSRAPEGVQPPEPTSSDE